MNEQNNSHASQLQEGVRLLPSQRALQLSAVCLGVAAIPMLTVLVQIAVLAAVQICFPALLKQSWFSVVCSAGSNYLVALPLSLLIFRMARTYKPAEPVRMGGLPFAALLVLSFGCAALGGLLGEWVNALLSRLSGKPIGNPVQAMTGTAPLWANFLFLGVLAPLAEELCYRKLVIDRLRPFGDRFAILFSGLVFGAIHGNFSQFFYAAAFGIVAGAVYLHTGKLRYTVVMHVALNLVGGVFSAELLKAINALGIGLQSGLSQLFAANIGVGIAYAVYQVLMYVCAVLSPVAAVYLYRCMPHGRPENRAEAKGVWRLMLSAPAFWILAAVLLILFIF